jgi:hypothetical protein
MSITATLIGSKTLRQPNSRLCIYVAQLWSSVHCCTMLPPPYLRHIPQPLHDQPQRLFRAAHATQHVHALTHQARRLADLLRAGSSQGQGRFLSDARLSGSAAYEVMAHRNADGAPPGKPHTKHLRPGPGPHPATLRLCVDSSPVTL